MNAPPPGRLSNRSRPEQARLAVAFAMGVVAVLFAVLNLEDVSVNWIVGTTDTPLIVVIVLCLLIGTAIGWTVSRRRI